MEKKRCLQWGPRQELVPKNILWRKGQVYLSMLSIQSLHETEPGTCRAAPGANLGWGITSGDKQVAADLPLFNGNNHGVIHTRPYRRLAESELPTHKPQTQQSTKIHLSLASVGRHRKGSLGIQFNQF